MAKAYLIDTTKCVGCRSCQVSCKQWCNLPAEKTALQPKDRGLQNPTVLSAKTFTVVTYSEVADDRAPGGLKYIFAKRQCMHCNDPACATACPVTALHKTKEGPVAYESEKCIGCRYCVMACPFNVPTAEWDSRAPKIRKCDMCYDRISGGGVPACVKACPSAAITYGDRDQLLAMAKKRIGASPGKYVNRIYGEKEAGGTGVLYMSSVPFEQIGFPEVGTASFAEHSNLALESVPQAVLGVGAVLGSLAWIVQRRKQEMARQGMTQEQIAAEFAPMQPAPAAKPPQPKPHKAETHVEFAPIQTQLWTRFNKMLLVLMAFGAISFLVRFALGLGGSTNLSDTHAWGLWIVFDLVWIAVAAGAFATAGLIYVFHRRDLYPLGRSAVLMGLLSYSFVTVTLIADLGLPWHAWQLLFQAPAHSAMFEVSWCIGLYVTILAFEFLPIPCERWGIPRAMEFWRKYSNVYVVFAITVFVYLLSRKVLWAAAACALFTMLAYKFRPRQGEKPVPVMLALAAVVFSTMHQSSLGSLFLLMSDKLSHLWWSPIMPIYFFLSAVVAGTAMVVLVEMWIARAYGRVLPMRQLVSMGQISFWALLAYELVRLGDVYQRGQLAMLRGHAAGGLFVAEIVLGGVVPLLLLSSASLRQRTGVLTTGASLAIAGVVFNRMNVVFFAMDLKGPMPQIAPASYSPSLVEWGISAGLFAGAIFMFGYFARLMPVLPRTEEVSGD